MKWIYHKIKEKDVLAANFFPGALNRYREKSREKQLIKSYASFRGRGFLKPPAMRVRYLLN